ncbi:MAG: aminotransferase class IV [Thermodesulfobacteriota bacterium]|nr:aminotransferase class IV [Thermodesulfobacteriota bacterium]
MIAYFNGTFIAKEDISISPDDRGFLFGDGLYEVIRSYHGHLFGAKDHIKRLNYGATHLKLSRTDFSWLEVIARELISINNFTSREATVYIQVTRGVAVRTHAFPTTATDLTIYMTASKLDTKKTCKNQEHGIHAITVPDIRWARCDLKTTALTPNVLANQMAVEKQAGEAIFIRDGVLLEGSHSNFMAVFNNVLVTAPLSNYILGGITRKFVLELCKQENIQVEERPIFEKDIHMASELMIVGTTVEVTPIVKLNETIFNNREPGPVTRTLQSAFCRKLKDLK